MVDYRPKKSENVDIIGPFQKKIDLGGFKWVGIKIALDYGPKKSKKVEICSIL